MACLVHDRYERDCENCRSERRELTLMLLVIVAAFGVATLLVGIVLR